jgi:peroxiredoxin
MQSLEENAQNFEAADTMIFGISVDSIPCNAAWAKEIQLNKVRLLSDFWPHGGVARSLGLFREREGFAERANVLADESGKVVFVKIHPVRETPDVAEVLAAARKK